MFFGVYHYSEASFTISRPPANNIGLVGHWTFDGKNVVNGVALDSVGTNNGNLINIATSTFYSIGKIGVKDGNNLKIYLNGVDSSAWTDTVSGTVQNANSNLTFGLDVSGLSPLSGILDEVRIYGRALSAGEIKMLYNMGR